MKRMLVGLLAALPLIVGVTAAQADGFGFGGGDQSSSTQGTEDVLVAGTVVSVNAQAGTFVANAFIVPADNQGGQGEDNDNDDQSGGSDSSGQSSHHGDNLDTPATTPPTTQVTITTDSNTEIEVKGQHGTVANLTPGDTFVAKFKAMPTDPIATVVSTPALSIKTEAPETPEQNSHGSLYAFVGSVTAVDPTAGTVTVNVTRSLPSSLVPASSGPVSFTVGPDTLILGGSSGLVGGSLSGVSVGDIVAGGLFAPGGETLAQVGMLPLRVLLDLPASSTSTSTPAQTAKAKTKALRRAVALLDGKAKGKAKGKHKAKKHPAHKR